MKITSATCTATTCYGKRIPGAPLRCPSCNSTLLRYSYAPKPAGVAR